ncbi:MAG: hypothetical protein H0A76_05640 [Candidatus Thiodubiliella endoseptemdiera]|uniref:Uncharacterized protein n=1 Tax=Candidatus Thiodubiliella endoseptemdiera TaxID=2738886 RepID=A0A853F597_9GAMM|nr:hypothetical protein [Candidatus Thiodubiliella endoseptemdiera]
MFWIKLLYNAGDKKLVLNIAFKLEIDAATDFDVDNPTRYTLNNITDVAVMHQYYADR